MRTAIVHAAALGFSAVAVAGVARAQAHDPTPGTTPPIELDGSIGPGGDVPFANHTWQIGEQLGEYRGETLLHSFGRFGVPAGEVAEFSAANGSPERVIARVTWGERSDIAGTLRSTIPGADLILMNPAGVRFEGGAQLDVQGSFTATSAGRVDFGAGKSFTTSLSDPLPVLTFEDPVRFGFLPSGGSAIEFRPLTDGPLSVKPGETLAAVGGSVRVGGSDLDTLSSPGSRIALVAGGPGIEVPADLESFDPSAIDPSVALGAVEIALDSAVRVSAAGSASGSLVVRGGSFRLTDRSSIIAVHGQAADSPYPNAVDIAVRDALRIDESSLVQVGTNGVRDDLQGGHARGGDLLLSGKSIEIENSELLLFTSRSGDPSNAFLGPHAVDSTKAGGRLSLSGNGRLITRSSGTAPGGQITVDVAELSLASGGRIVSEATRAGAGGPLHVIASRIDASDVRDAPLGTVISSSTASQSPDPVGGNAGRIAIEAGSISLRDGAQISSITSGSGDAGRIDVHADAIEVTGRALGANGIGQNASIETRAQAGSTGMAGERMDDDSVRGVTITADRVHVADGGRLSTTTQGAGAAGDLVLDVKGGSVRLDGPLPAEVSSRSQVTEAGDAGRGGRIFVETGELRVAGGSQITTSTDGTSDAGTVDIVADQVEIAGRSGPTLSGIYAQTLAERLAEGGDAGSVTIDSAGDVALRDGATIRVATTNGGAAGTVDIHADGTLLVEDGEISASTSWSGNAGGVVIDAGQVEVRGGQARILAETTASPDLLEEAGAQGGDAGSVTIDASGDVAIRNGIRDQSGIRVETRNDGEAGRVDLVSGGRLILDSGSISARAQATSTAPSGSIDVTAAKGVFLSNGSVIGSRSFGTNQAGTVAIHAGPILELRDSQVSTQSDSQSDANAGGGRITIEAADQIVLVDSQIDTSVAKGGGTGGTITIDPDLMVVNRSAIRAKSDAGNGGRIFITAGNFVVSEGSEISAASEGGGVDGTVVIDSPDAELSTERAEPAHEYLDVAGLLRTSCGAAGGQAASFVVARVAGLPASPEGPLPAPLWESLPQAGAPGAGVAPISNSNDPSSLRVAALAGGCQAREEL